MRTKWMWGAAIVLTAAFAGSSGAQSELPVERIPKLGEAAEAYFSPDGKSLICNAKLEDDDVHHVYTVNLDGTGIRRINDTGADACSHYFPDGKRLIWTSTRDHLDLPPGNFSDPPTIPGARSSTPRLSMGATWSG